MPRLSHKDAHACWCLDSVGTFHAYEYTSCVHDTSRKQRTFTETILLVACAVDWSPETLLQTFKFEHGYTCNSKMARLLTEVLSNLPMGECVLVKKMLLVYMCMSSHWPVECCRDSRRFLLLIIEP